MFGSVIAFTIGPVSKLLFRRKVCRSVRRSMLSGIRPVKEFRLSWRFVSRVRLPMFVGMDPWSLFRFMLSNLRDERPFRLDGMVPVKRFASKMIDSNRLKAAIELGIEPVRTLV
jgi:hypothetical protein